ncbi:MAG: peptidyl-prolyl cis-trans isomerase [Acidobacteria bacterium]|nr:peptidyl-prolyl cis-trans isomerase [Acidobacteriota bacterium]
MSAQSAASPKPQGEAGQATQAKPALTQPTPGQPGPNQPAARIEILEQILVKVNGEILTKTDIETRQVAALRQRTQQMSDEDLKKAVAEVTPDLLVDAVDEMLLLQRGKELGYKVTDEQFKRVLENIRKENKLDDDAQFAAALRQEGLSVDGLRKNLEKQMIINQVQQAEVLSKISINEGEAQAYYNAHKNEFTTAASLTLRELLVSVPADPRGVNAAVDEAAKAKAESAMKRAKAGESFAKLVAELSDAPSKANGGLVGPLSIDELDPGIRKLVEPLKQGDVTDVVRTANGWALLQVDTLTPPVLKTFEAARDEIADKVFSGLRRDAFEKYLTKIRAEAIIEWKNDEMRKLYDAKISAPAPRAPGQGS